MSSETEDHKDGQRQVADVNIHEIGATLITLGKQLVTIGEHTDSRSIRKHIDEVSEHGDDEDMQELSRELTGAIRQTLSGLNNFRKDYANWERLTVEYALTRNGFTQRDVARLLGVGLSTVNRWAQHPLTYDD